MTKILDDIYYYRHPFNANCVVFAFMTGNGREFDLIDTGINKIPILQNLLKQMHKDGLDHRHVRNIYHGHYHFDHVQCDRFFQKKATLNKSNVEIYVAEPDAYRTHSNYSIVDNNIHYLTNYFKRFPAKLFPSIPYLGKFFLDPMLKVKNPSSINFYQNNQELLIGNYKVKAITTGGHTEGHSFFWFPEIKMLHTGDNDALNEMLVDFSCVIKSMKIADDLKPEMIFIGHNEPKRKQEDSQEWIDRWFREYDQIWGMLKPYFRNNVRINITKLMEKMGGWMIKMDVIRFFAFMNLFVILRHLENKGFGKIQLMEDDITLYFQTAANIEDMELNLSL